jgi:hypothetical protein
VFSNAGPKKTPRLQLRWPWTFWKIQMNGGASYVSVWPLVSRAAVERHEYRYRSLRPPAPTAMLRVCWLGGMCGSWMTVVKKYR